MTATIQSNKNVYVFAKLGKFEFIVMRLFGSGLGNILFPWARSVIAARKFELRTIEPTWLNFKVGSLIRRERDPRFYSDLFINADNNISGLRKLFVLLFFKKIPEVKLGLCSPAGSSVVVFTGMEGFFRPIIQDHEYIRSKLIEITAPIHLHGLSYDFSNSISVHVRLGDFKVGNQTTPIVWFVNVVNLIRKSCGSNLKLFIFSDGSDVELAPLLALENSQRLAFGSSIADLHALSKSNILVGSRGSTFSMWAAYLGRMPVIWPIGGLTQPLYVDNCFHEIESDGHSIPDSFPLGTDS